MKKANRFLKLLTGIAEHLYEKEDACLADYMTLRRTQREIESAYKANEIPDVAYRVLSKMCTGLMEDYKEYA